MGFGETHGEGRGEEGRGREGAQRTAASLHPLVGPQEELASAASERGCCWPGSPGPGSGPPSWCCTSAPYAGRGGGGWAEGSWQGPPCSARPRGQQEDVADVLGGRGA